MPKKDKDGVVVSNPIVSGKNLLLHRRNSFNFQLKQTSMALMTRMNKRRKEQQNRRRSRKLRPKKKFKIRKRRRDRKKLQSDQIHLCDLTGQAFVFIGNKSIFDYIFEFCIDFVGFAIKFGMNLIKIWSFL